MTSATNLRRIAHREDGFTMIIAVMVLFVTSLILAAVFTAANGDIKLTSTDSHQKSAYYAALAGISEYRYQLNTNPNYWLKCPSKENAEVPGETGETYTVKTLPATGHTESECKSEKQYAIVESASSAKGTFRIESTGTYKGETRSLVATFTHPGFLNYVYFTNYEILDPTAQNPSPTNCEHYYSYRKEHTGEGCVEIEFAEHDKINGPLHTNDAAYVCENNGNWPTFGRTSADAIEMNGGYHAACSAMSQIHTVGTYTEKAPTLLPPETDSELLATAGLKLKGKTIIELKSGSPNTIAIENSALNGGSRTIESFPKNGVIYVENSTSGCGISYSPFKTNYTGDTSCGNVYIKGTYSESLTVAAANDVIINGNLTTTSAGSGEPTGSATLGLIATNFVRVYHPVAKAYKATLNTAKTVSTKTETPKTTESSTLTPELSKSGRYTPSFYETATKSGGGCSPASKWETVSSKCKSKECTLGGTYLTGKGECAKCTGEDAYIASENKCANSTCSSGYTYAGNGECAKCASGYTYLSSKKKCASLTCPSGDTYIGEGLCAYCNAEYTYLAGENTCAGTSCSSGYTYIGNYQCQGCNSGETYDAGEKKCGKCESSDQYISKGECEYENTSSGCDAKNLNASEDPNGWGSFEPTIDAAILSTAHSFIVDNYACGAHLGNLHVWGSIAQFWRGPVGRGETGYTKNYNYDERLATEQPPNFLSPSTTAWKLTRVTAPPNNFTG
jgi:Tfp pilus assembly protein PilX